MFIKKIEIKNFKNFDKLETDFNKLNVIVGANASGKSNFIQSLKFIRDIYNFGIEDAIQLQGGIDFLRNIKLPKTEKILINIKFKSNYIKKIQKEPENKTLDYRIDTIDYTISINQKINTNELQIKEKILYTASLKKNRQNASTRIRLIKFELINKNGKLFQNNFDDGIKIDIEAKEIIKLNADIFFAELPPFKMLQDRFDKNKTLLEQFGPLLIPLGINFSIFDFDLKSSKTPTTITGKKRLQENGENIAIVIKHIIEDKENFRLFSNLLKDTLSFVNDFEIEKSYDKSLSFKIKEKYNPDIFIPSSLLSDGTISITALITALFFEDYPFAIFEEPEQGIHPALISKLMQLFYDASQHKQIIITTHNPEIVKHTEFEDLLLLIRDDKGFSTINKPAESKMVKSFIENELGINDLYVQNLLD